MLIEIVALSTRHRFYDFFLSHDDGLTVAVYHLPALLHSDHIVYPILYLHKLEESAGAAADVQERSCLGDFISQGASDS